MARTVAETKPKTSPARRQLDRGTVDRRPISCPRRLGEGAGRDGEQEPARKASLENTQLVVQGQA